MAYRTPTNVETIRELFGTVRERWVKGINSSYKGRTQCFCLSGAVNRVYRNDSSIRVAVIAKLAQSIRTLYPNLNCSSEATNIGTVVCFNDRPRTSFKDILRVVRHAKV